MRLIEFWVVRKVGKNFWEQIQKRLRLKKLFCQFTWFEIKQYIIHNDFKDYEKKTYTIEGLNWVYSKSNWIPRIFDRLNFLTFLSRTDLSENFWYNSKTWICILIFNCMNHAFERSKSALVESNSKLWIRFANCCWNLSSSLTHRY